LIEAVSAFLKLYWINTESRFLRAENRYAGIGFLIQEEK